jgi:RHS repeat-associated protein
VTGGTFGTGTYTYDANGNLATAPNGRTATWTSFDMPLTLTKGSNTATFTYGPEHQRTKQVRSGNITVTYAGAMEVETNTSTNTRTIKTYWPMGIGVEIDRPATGSPAVTPPTQLNWLHKDRLGSPIAISGETGALRERLAYDAWGKRRTTNGAVTGTPATPTPDTIDGVVDNRGFTGHEMLDQLDLVHMNGRIYDPLIGRFLSADPILQDPMNGQSYNRYSYVMNNPTNFTDPTGFSRIESAAAEKWEKEFAVAWSNLTDEQKLKVADSRGASFVASVLAQVDFSKVNAKQGGMTPQQAGARLGGLIEERLKLMPEPKHGDREGWSARSEELTGMRAFYNATMAATGMGDRYDTTNLVLGIQIGVANLMVRNDLAAAKELAAAGIAMSMQNGGSVGRAGGGPRAAASAKQAKDLSKHLGYVEKYGKGGVKELENGRIRYYGEIQPADKAGEMAGRRYVHEYDSLSGKSRGWHETVDHAGNVRQVRPELNNGSKTHYQFDSSGKYTGSW